MLRLGIPSLAELRQRMSDDDWLNWQALDHLIAWSGRREDYRAALLVQEVKKIERLISGGQFDIPAWDVIIPAPIDCTREARLNRLQKMKMAAVEKLKFLFGNLAKKPEETKEEAKR